MTEIEKTEGELKVLQAKLELLKEMEKHKTPCEEAYQKVYGWYPPTTPSVSNYEDNRWSAFQNGYNASQEPKKEQQVKELVKESVKWCEEHPNESVEDWVNTQPTDKEVEKFVEKKKEVNDELIEKLIKNPPSFLRFELSPSLEDRIYKWWETCFVYHPEWSMEECVEDLLDIITLFLPAEQNSSGSQNIDTIVAVEAHNELLQKIKSKIHNKKVTP